MTNCVSVNDEEFINISELNIERVFKSGINFPGDFDTHKYTVIIKCRNKKLEYGYESEQERDRVYDKILYACGGDVNFA